jgi:hypothetical protein
MIEQSIVAQVSRLVAGNSYASERFEVNPCAE